MPCGARTRRGTPCQQPSGWGTDHPGEGRCKLHGGCSLRGQWHPGYRHGRYARHQIVVWAEKMRGIVGVNDAKVRFDESGRCEGIVQIGNGPQLEAPIPPRRQDIEAFRRIPGYRVVAADSVRRAKGAEPSRR